MPFLQEQKTAATHLIEIVVPSSLPLTTLVRPEHRVPMSSVVVAQR